MSKRPWILEAIGSPEKHPFVFIFVFTLAISVAGNGISILLLENLCNWLEKITPFTKLSYQIILIIFLVVAIIFGSINLEPIWQRFNGRSVPKTNFKPLGDKTYKGLIVLMSTNENPPAKEAICHHWNNGRGNLKHCWIIGIGEESRIATKKLIEDLDRSSKIPTAYLYYDKVYGDKFSLNIHPDLENDPNHVRKLIEYIYDEARLSYFIEESDIIIDFTGGKKTTTAGAILAGAKPGRNMEYISGKYDPSTRTTLDPKLMEIDISYQVKPVK
jgi:hypothetical protein